MSEILSDIQTALAFQEKQINDLSDMVNEQWTEIERLKRKLSDAESKIFNLQNGSDESADQANVRPPHW
jgi:SlyX protein